MNGFRRLTESGHWALGILLVTLTLRLPAADWPQYRGPAHNGVSPEVIRTNWTGQPPRQLWKVGIGAALSSLTIQNGRVYSMERHGDTITGREFCVALDDETGARLWETDVDLADYPHGGVGSDDGPRSTPVADGDRVYALGSYLNLVCMNVTNGAIRWSRDLVGEFAPTLAGTYRGVVDWQSAGSPLVAGDLVYVASAANTDRLFAFNKHTGALVWRRHNDTMTQASPVFATVAGVPQVIFFTRSGLVSVMPDTGNELWRYPFAFSTSTAASPVVGDDLVYCSAAYGTGAGVVRIEEANGTLTATQVWRKPGDHQNHWGTPVLHDGHLYGPYGQSSLVMECIELATGTSKWQRSGIGYGSVLKVGSHLLALHADGTVVLLRFNPVQYDEIDRFRALTGKCWNNPAVSDGRIFLRSTLEVAAYDVSVPLPHFDPASVALTPQGFQMTVGLHDGTSIDAARAERISILHSADPATPFPLWAPLTEPLLLENGRLILNDPGAVGESRRFYRAEEQP